MLVKMYAKVSTIKKENFFLFYSSKLLESIIKNSAHSHVSRRKYWWRHSLMGTGSANDATGDDGGMASVISLQDLEKKISY